MWKKHLDNRCPHPLPDQTELKEVDITKEDEEIKSVPKEGEPEIITIEEESKFATEYSASGWLRWEPTAIPPWYIVWRFTNLPKGTNNNAGYLGDRDLTIFKHEAFYHVTTYKYVNLVG